MKWFVRESRFIIPRIRAMAVSMPLIPKLMCISVGLGAGASVCFPIPFHPIPIPHEHNEGGKIGDNEIGKIDGYIPILNQLLLFQCSQRAFEWNRFEEAIHSSNWLWKALGNLWHAWALITHRICKCSARFIRFCGAVNHSIAQNVCTGGFIECICSRNGYLWLDARSFCMK